MRVAEGSPIGISLANQQKAHSERIGVQCGNATELGPIMQRLFEETPSPDVSVILSDATANDIVVVGTPLGAARVRQLLIHCAAVNDDPGSDILALHHVNASEQIPILAASAPRDVRVTSHEPTNSLIIEGPVAARLQVLRRARLSDARQP